MLSKVAQCSMTNYKYITNPSAPSTLTLTPSGNKVGDAIEFQDSNNTDSQIWDFTEDGHFVNKDSGYVIEVSTASAGTVLKLAKKKDDSNQKWTYTDFYTIVSQTDTNLCIWAQSGIIYTGAQATIETVVDDTASQRWWLLSP